ncbi:MAG: hypothetical protein OHK0045_15310 [Raineya sp.]
MKKNLFYSLLMISLLLIAGKCKKKDDGTQAPAGVKGSWKINSITNSAGTTPTNLQNLVNGSAIFGNTDYEFKNANGSSAEAGGTYSYDAANSKLNMTPAGNSVFTNANAPYTFDATLAGNNLQLSLNIAPPNKPSNVITVSLTKN